MRMSCVILFGLLASNELYTAHDLLWKTSLARSSTAEKKGRPLQARQISWARFRDRLLVSYSLETPNQLGFG
uniref:Secreted protein n=1 Tax=Setaria viridis TaxID=4556 RepID=A0A4U6W9F6_SETVI|nr:hypothetical protein SEVIR_1G159750v2 [Setaria viridis]